MDKENFIIGGLIAVVVAFIGFAVYGSILEQRDWEAFAKQHNCRPVEYKKGQVGTGVGNTFDAKGNVGIGVVTVTTPDQTCYECDDGKRYWR